MKNNLEWEINLNKKVTFQTIFINILPNMAIRHFYASVYHIHQIGILSYLLYRMLFNYVNICKSIRKKDE